MSESIFISSDAHLCKFLEATGNNWRNTIYIECGDCQRACSRRCHDLLCAFTEDAVPVIIPEHDATLLWHTTIDKSECLLTMSRARFCELYKGWIMRHIRNPAACPLSDLHVKWGKRNAADFPAFGNL